MVDLLAEKSFALVLSDVREQIGEQRFELWFGNCKLTSMFRGTLTIGVPNVFFQDWIANHYESNLRFAVERVLGISMKIKILVDADLNQDLQQRIQDDSLNELLADDNHRQYGMTLDQFVRVGENETAYRAVRHLVDNEAFGFNPLYIVGPAGVGKSHLAASFREFRGGLNPDKPRILETDALRFTKSFTLALKTKRMPDFRATFENLDVVVFDEVHRLRGKKATQQEFLHLLRNLVQQRVQVVLVARHHPREIHDITEAFKSNLMSGMMVPIESYTHTSLSKIVIQNLARLKSNSDEEGLKEVAGSDVVRTLSRHCRGSVRELTSQLRRAHVLAYMKGERLSGKFVEDHLDEFGADPQVKQEVGTVFDTICADFGVERAELISKRKTKCLALPRAIAARALRDFHGMTYKEVGHHLGSRSHTSIYMMIKKYRSVMENDHEVKKTLDRLSGFSTGSAGNSQ
ncbi:MAG: chromosomal replication initiator protein [Planctomycetota bacterium]|jgi:chromosomal replication initiator protein